VPGAADDRNHALSLIERFADLQTHMRLPALVFRRRRLILLEAEPHFAHRVLDRCKDGRPIGHLLDKPVPPALAVAFTGGFCKRRQGIAPHERGVRRRFAVASAFVEPKRYGRSMNLTDRLCFSAQWIACHSGENSAKG
jgi:hypothetical protein